MSSVDAALVLQRLERVLEALPVDPFDDLAEHLHQPPVRVEREAPVAGARREPFRGRVAEAEVEDRVHHPGHRDRGARAHGHEQRVAACRRSASRCSSSRRDVLGDLVLEPVRDVARGHVGAAGVGRDREPGRHGQPQQRHLGEPDPLPAEELATAVGGLVEVVDVVGSIRATVTTPCRAARAARVSPEGGTTSRGARR